MGAMKTAFAEDRAALHRIFDPIGRCLTPAVARKIVRLRADPSLQTRLDELATKSNEGQLTAAERTEYETYVRGIHFLTVLQSKARRLLAQSSKS
jgi:hypothetical protein